MLNSLLQEVENKTEEWEGQGKTVILVALGRSEPRGKGKEKDSTDARPEGLIGLIAIADKVKPEAAATIQYLRGAFLTDF